MRTSCWGESGQANEPRALHPVLQLSPQCAMAGGGPCVDLRPSQRPDTLHPRRCAEPDILVDCSRMKERLLVTVVAFLLPVHGVGQPQDSSNLNSLVQRAETGDLKAQLELGFRYEYGTGGAQRNPYEAIRWYRKAADQGDGGARDRIAGIYFEGNGVQKDYAAAASWYGCPKPDARALANCIEASYKDLPPAALELLQRMKCKVSSNYDYGSAVDLNGDGSPEYQICCSDSPHGPCGAVVIGKVGSVWKDLTAKEGVLGFATACGLFVVLESRHGGFSDVCLPNQCSLISSPTGKPCIPTIWSMIDGRYRSVQYTPVPAPK